MPLRQAEHDVARKSPGPRQPISQARPKTARAIVKGRPAPAPKKGPPTSNVPPGGRKSVIPRSQSGALKRTKAPRRIPSDQLPAHAQTIYERLRQVYPDAHCELDFQDAWQLLQATILSAQCTDKRVNMVTPVLFSRYPTAESLARAKQEDVEEIIKSTGFFRNKAKNIIAMAGGVADLHGGTVPSTLEELVKLPGVGRKTANFVLGNAFAINEGVVVDTHVGRLSNRLGLTSETDPVKVEQILMTQFARDRWTMLAHLLIFHGRRVCDAKKPRCGECSLADVCPSRQ